VIRDRADAIVPADSLPDRRERFLEDGVGVDVDGNGASDEAALEQTQEEMPVGTADVDDGRLANPLVEQGPQRIEHRPHEADSASFHWIGLCRRCSMDRPTRWNRAGSRGVLS